MTLESLKEVLEQIEGAWNGDESGEQEDRAMLAKEALEVVKTLEGFINQLGLQYAR